MYQFSEGLAPDVRMSKAKVRARLAREQNEREKLVKQRNL